MQENTALKTNIIKYLEKRQKNAPTRLDSILRMYVKGELKTFCEKYPFIINVFASLPDYGDLANFETLNNVHKKKVTHAKDKTFLTLCFEQSGFFGEIIFFDDYYEYHILNDNKSDGDDIMSSSKYSETTPFKSVVEEVWNEVSVEVKIEEDAKNEKIKKEKSKYKILYIICYVVACLIAVGVILYNRSANNSKALWFLLIAIIPAIIGSCFKYKTLDRK